MVAHQEVVEVIGVPGKDDTSPQGAGFYEVAVVVVGAGDEAQRISLELAYELELAELDDREVFGSVILGGYVSGREWVGRHGVWLRVHRLYKT
jgi:hypothetical protein